MAEFFINVDYDGNGFSELEFAGESLSVGDLCYLGTDTKYYKASALSKTTSTSELRIALSNIPADTKGPFLIKGKFDISTLSAGSKYYMDTTYGKFTSTQPNGSVHNVIRYIGTAHSDTKLEFNPDATYLYADGTEINEVTVSGSGSGSGHTIQDEGTALATRLNLNFIGSGVTVTDNAGDSATDVTINDSGAHTHNNFALLQTYTQTEANLSDAVTKKHDVYSLGSKSVDETSLANGRVLYFNSSSGNLEYMDKTIITDHTGLSNIGTNTHAQIDTHIADTTIHYNQAAISITESQISDLGSYEDDLGNPSTDGYILSSTAAGVRSWTAPSSGGGVESDTLQTVTDRGAVTTKSITANGVTSPTYSGATNVELKAPGYSRVYIDTDNNDAASKFQILSNTSTYNSGNVVMSIDQLGNLVADGTVTVGTGNTSVQWTTAYTHSQLSSGNPHNVIGSDVLMTGYPGTLTLSTPVQASDTVLEAIERIENSLGSGSHTHNNYALLQTYTQTESDLADAVSKKHNSNVVGTKIVSETNIGDDKILKYNTSSGKLEYADQTVETDHTNLSNIGTNTHAEIDTHISNTTIHYPQSSIQIAESQVTDLVGKYEEDLGTPSTSGYILSSNTSNVRSWIEAPSGGGSSSDTLQMVTDRGASTSKLISTNGVTSSNTITAPKYTSSSDVVVEAPSSHSVDLKAPNSVRLYIDSNNNDTTNKLEVLSNVSTYNATHVILTIDQLGNLVADGTLIAGTGNTSVQWTAGYVHSGVTSGNPHNVIASDVNMTGYPGTLSLSMPVQSTDNVLQAIERLENSISSSGAMQNFILKEGNGSETSTVTNGETVTFANGAGIINELTSTSSGGTIQTSVDYVGSNNIIGSATNTGSAAILDADSLLYYDDTDDNAKRGLVSALPFGKITSVTAGVGTQGGGTSGTVDVALDYTGTDNFINVASNLENTNIGTGDKIIYHDATDNNIKRGLVGDLPFTSNTGDITSVNVVAGSGLTGGGSVSSGAYSKTLNVGGSSTISVAANSVAVKTSSIETDHLKGTPGDGTTSQFLRSLGDGGFVWATPTNTNRLTTHYLRDDADVTLTINNGKYIKYIGGNGIATAVTDHSNGSSADPYDITYSLGTLSSNWNAGPSYLISAKSFTSTVASGTPPFTVTSGTYVPKLYVYRSAIANYWTSTRTLTLAGDLSGSVAIRGNSDMTLTATVANNSHSHSNYITSNANDTASGSYHFTNTTDSDDPSHGALRLVGGMGIMKNLYVGEDVTATAFYESSDERVKENIKKLDDRFVSFNFKADTDKRTKYGVIAQDIEKNEPELVKIDSKGYRSVDYISLLVKEVVGLRKKNKELEERLDRLEDIIQTKLY